MKRKNLSFALIAAGLLIGGVSIANQRSTGLELSAQTSDTPTKIEPAKREPIEGSELMRLILTARAAERLDIQTAPLGEKVVPYSALLYDTHGKTWVYTSPEPLTFVRHQVEVDYIEGDAVFLSDGPATGTSVVTVAAAELYGTEYKLGH